MIIVIGYVTAEPFCINDFSTDIQTLVTSTRLQEGCLFYAISVEDKSTGRMLVVERWRNQDVLNAHLQRSETLAFVEKWKNCMESDVLKYDASNERGLMD